MAYQDYRYPRAGGAYRWHIQQKCQQAIGRQPIALMDTDKQTIIRFDPPLDENEKSLVDQIFSNPATVCNAPVLSEGETYLIKDIYDSDFKEKLEKQLGCDVIFWFPKSNPKIKDPDRIAIRFSKPLSEQDKRIVEDAVSGLTLGWLN